MAANVRAVADAGRRVTESVRLLLRTEGKVFFVTGSGTAGMETALMNIVAPGETILVLSSGKVTPALAPISMLMLHMVMRPDTDMASTTGPMNSAQR